MLRINLLSVSSLIIGITCSTIAQEKHAFKLEAGFGLNNFSMENLNQRINQSNLSDDWQFDSTEIRTGNNITLAISYQPFNLINFGVYGNYLYALADRRTNYFIPSPEPGGEMSNAYGKEYFNVQSKQIGLFNQFIINELPFWKSTKILNRIECNLNIHLGVGFSTLTTRHVFDHLEDNLLYLHYSAIGFQQLYSIKFGVITVKRKYFSSIGINIGYQQFDTSPLTGINDISYPNNNQLTSLSYSGFFVGGYLTFSK